jgi:hypothetical protein
MRQASHTAPSNSNPPGRPLASDAWLVFGCAALFFGTSVTTFQARVTDISALRVLAGDVPYRDFWTMYAPGSFTVLAMAFAAFGREVIVSNLLGVLTAAGSVAVYYLLAGLVASRGVAALLAAVVAAAYYRTGYHDGFTSFPPAFLLMLAAVVLTSRRHREPGVAWALLPGLLFGLAALFKHDVTAYVALATGMAAGVMRHIGGIRPRWTPVVAAAMCASVIVGAAVLTLVVLGAGPAMWDGFIRFVADDFRYVRPESFPLVPRIGASLLQTARGVLRWGSLTAPLVALVVGLAIRRRTWQSPDPIIRLVSVIAFVAFWLHWIAAHVQVNTHVISLTAWGGLAAGAAISGWEVDQANRARWARVALAAWTLGLLVEPAARVVVRATEPSTWVGLDRLRGIRVATSDAAWMRQLAQRLAAGDPRAAVLFAGNRNDLNIFAESTPYWLTSRRPASAYHELHPGVTDTEAVQRRIIAGLSPDVPPIIVREYRFSDAVVDDVLKDMALHVPVGSHVLDAWIDERYLPGSRYGSYEVMVAR